MKKTKQQEKREQAQEAAKVAQLARLINEAPDVAKLYGLTDRQARTAAQVLNMAGKLFWDAHRNEIKAEAAAIRADGEYKTDRQRADALADYLQWMADRPNEVNPDADYIAALCRVGIACIDCRALAYCYFWPEDEARPVPDGVAVSTGAIREWAGKILEACDAADILAGRSPFTLIGEDDAGSWCR